jgi:DUF4097 and DUF4098 domain-containing protein YvlB
MNPRAIGILITLALIVGLAVAPAAQGKSEFEEEFDVESGQTIELKMKQGGSLDVEGWDRDVVRVVCIAKLHDIEDWDIEIKRTREGLNLTAELDRRFDSNSFTVQLMVPRDFNIETRSGGGHITITDVTGDFRGSTGGGQIELVNVSGTARLTTGGGKIKILDSELNGKVSTGGGGGLVRNVVGNVKATSGGGLVSYENVRDRDGDLRGPKGRTPKGTTEGTRLVSTAGGAIRLREAPEGAIVSTGGGDIDISNAERFVKAKTGGGDIDIEIRDGYVVANTGAGDIEVIVRGDLGNGDDGVDISTGYGEVTVILPADASVEFDLDLSYTKNSSRDFSIKSDFDMDLEHTDKWESRHGSPRKHIYGTGRINGGKHRIEISGVNGDIRIKKR